MIRAARAAARCSSLVPMCARIGVLLPGLSSAPRGRCLSHECGRRRTGDHQIVTSWLPAGHVAGLRGREDARKDGGGGRDVARHGTGRHARPHLCAVLHLALTARGAPDGAVIIAVPFGPSEYPGIRGRPLRLSARAEPARPPRRRARRARRRRALHADHLSARRKSRRSSRSASSTCRRCSSCRSSGALWFGARDGAAERRARSTTSTCRRSAASRSPTPSNWVALIAFFVVALIASSLAEVTRTRTREARGAPRRGRPRGGDGAAAAAGRRASTTRCRRRPRASSQTLDSARRRSRWRP